MRGLRLSLDNSLSNKKLPPGIRQEVLLNIRPTIVELITHEILYIFIIVVFSANLLVAWVLILLVNNIIGEMPIFVQIILYVSDLLIVLIFVRHGLQGINLRKKRKPPQIT